jgi:hypothetical protein
MGLAFLERVRPARGEGFALACPRQPQSRRHARVANLLGEPARGRRSEKSIVGTFAFTRALRVCHSYSSTKKGRKTMKRALIAIASVAVLVPAAWVVEANANLMPNSEEPVAMRAGALLEGALLTVGWSILLAPVRRPTTSSGPHRQTGHGNGTGLPAQTDAATCASRTPTPCAGTGIKRRVKIERSSLLLF